MKTLIGSVLVAMLCLGCNEAECTVTETEEDTSAVIPGGVDGGIDAPTGGDTVSFDTCEGCRDGNNDCVDSTTDHCGIGGALCELCEVGECQVAHCLDGECAVFTADDGTECTTGICTAGRCETP